MANGDEKLGDEIILQRNTVAVQRSKTLWGGALYERLHLQHCGQQPLQMEIEILFGADFADVFELVGRHARAAASSRQPLLSAA